MKIFFIIFSVLLVSLAKAQNTNINCEFLFFASEYTCEIIGVRITDNENANFVIGGVHLPGLGNNDVVMLDIRNSDIPFIITQFFTTFPNIGRIFIWNGGLRRIHPNAFINTSGVAELSIVLNPIDAIYEGAFNGLSSVQVLSLMFNQIRHIHFNAFRSMPHLFWLFLTGNQLESLDGRLIANLQFLEQAWIRDNQINGIQRSFLDNLPRLRQLDLRSNHCINQEWELNSIVTVETIRNELATCFDNFDNSSGDDDLDRFHVKVRGPMGFVHKHGTGIV